MANARILIVEDDKLSAAYLRKMLQAAGYQVTAVASGELAVQAVAADPPEVVLMDIMLAGEMDGIAAAAQIRAQHDLPVLYLTAYLDGDLLGRLKATEPFGYLLKPFHEQEVCMAIDLARSRHKLETSLKDASRQLAQETAAHKQTAEALFAGREQLRHLAARLSAAEEAERQRIARELHDRVGQNLTALSLNLSILQGQLPSEVTPRMRERLDDSQNLLEETTAVIRNMMAELRPSVLDDYGLLAALRWYAELFGRRTGLPVTVQGAEDALRLPIAKETALFRIAQEALTNVAKHAHAAQVTIALDKNATGANLTIMDNGCGFDPAAPQSAAWGLIAMRERALAIGGSLDITSAPGRGTKIIVEIG